MYTRAELLLLAVALSDHTGIALSTLGIKITGNDKFFVGLLDGGDCRMSSAERASEYFDATWPMTLPWPGEVPQQRRPVHLRTPRTVSALSRARAKGKLRGMASGI